MNVRQLCFSVTSVLCLVILVFPSVLSVDDTSSNNNNQEYQEDNDDVDDEDDTPPENVDFEPFGGGDDDIILNERLAPGAAGARCPPPARTSTHELCSRRTCTHDVNCTRSARDNSTQLVCCFNGCVRACVLPIEAPIAFDWIEKPTQLEQSIAPSETVHSGAAESMSLPGGCIVSTTQFNKLETFKMNQHVSHCFCDIGGIFCKIAES